MRTRLRNLLVVVGPGILVAATGVGAGDLATASLAGGKLGLAVLWAVVLGAGLKFVLNEGLARWQLATGDTLLEGCVERFGRPVQWLFLGYLLLWSFLVAAALMSAIGVTAHAIWPVFGPNAAAADKVFYGILHSALAVVLVKLGGYRLFEKVMSACIGVMFVVVVASALALQPAPEEVLSGLAMPRVPPGGIVWTIALMGGIGGTVTVLCYGYWIREEGRTGAEHLKTCRIDLAAGYAMTALFGIAMVIVGSSLGELEGGGATLMVEIAKRLEEALGTLGPIARWAFLLGAWAAVFSSLLGVWQSVPYLFADFWLLTRRASADPGHRNQNPSGGHKPHDQGRQSARLSRVNAKSIPYQAYLYGIALVPVLGLVAGDFRTMQKTYAVVGALFIPVLALALLVLNGRARWVGTRYRNSLWTSIVLVATLAFFLAAGAMQVADTLFPAAE